MIVAIVLILGAALLVAVGIRSVDNTRRAIEALEDAEPFTDNDPRLEGVKAPEEE